GQRMDQHPSTRSCSSRGATACEAIPNEPPMNLYIHTTTGTRFELTVPLEETVEGLNKRLSQRFKVPKERLALLHKETRLSSGKLQDFGITDGSKLTLVPTVEAGLMSQASRPEQSVMQALESLTETQVSDFLSGRSPLTLALRVGDHMMFVQLQLAAQQSGAQQQVQHRHVIARESGVSTSGPSSGQHPRTGHHPHHSHPHPHPAPSTATAAPASARQTVAPSSAPAAAPLYCPPARPSPLSAGMFRSQNPGETPACATAASPCPETTARSSKQKTKVAPLFHFFMYVFLMSRTLHPNCQDSTGRPRRDIGTILQILNDLLSATRHYQGVPPSLTQLRCQTQCSPASPAPSPPPSPPATGGASLSASLSAKATSVPSASKPSLHPLQCQNQIRMCKPSGDRLRQTENRATRCKVERLQLLMQQKRLRRKARRDSRGPYHWLPNRKSSRSYSNSSVSSEGSVDMDFEDSLWKPDVKADMKSEFVVV
ncbi:MIDNB protein, partial [Polyodon spathula]|nr:MIDNB protein [Polyodon spathula]